MRKSVWIEKLPNGYRVRFPVVVGVSTVNKKPIEKYDGRYFVDHNEAQKFAAVKKVGILNKLQGSTDTSLSPSECFTEFIDFMKSKREEDEYRDSTIEMYEYALEDYLTIFSSMSQLDPTHFSAYLTKKEYGITTRSIRLRALRRFCNWAMSEGYLEKSPFTKIDKQGKATKFKVPKSRQVGRTLELTELSNIIKNIDPRGLLYLSFIMEHGSRRTETLKADWKHINLVKGTWTIPTTDNKTKFEKTIPLYPRTVQKLQEIPLVERQGLVFKGFNTTTPRWYIQQACKKAGIKPEVNTETGKEEWPSPHDFRHSFVSHWEGDPRLCAEMVGWTTLAMFKRYSHFNIENIRKANLETGIGAKLEHFADTPPNNAV